MNEVALEVSGLEVRFAAQGRWRTKRKFVRPVAGVNLRIGAGEIDPHLLTVNLDFRSRVLTEEHFVAGFQFERTDVTTI